MDPNYPLKTLNPNSEKVGVSLSEGLSYTVVGTYLNWNSRKAKAKFDYKVVFIFEFYNFFFCSICLMIVSNLVSFISITKQGWWNQWGSSITRFTKGGPTSFGVLQ